MRDVEVRRVAVHIALLVPSWVDHGADRGIVVGLRGTTAHADGVVLHDSGGEELLEPVRVAELCLL